MTVWYFFVCYREGWGGMKQVQANVIVTPLVHLSSGLANFSCTSSSPLPSITPKLFQATHQKNAF